MTDAGVATARGEAGGKGLRAGALGMMSGIVIGVASTAPGYSLAASLGLVVAAVGLQAPAIMFLAFLPMLFIAAAYYYRNRADPDCGTTFSWVTKAMGPRTGWLGGWGIIVAHLSLLRRHRGLRKDPVLPARRGDRDPRPVRRGGPRRALEEMGERLTGEALAALGEPPVPATAAVVDARPADALLALAEEHDAAMIVVGTHSERPLLGVVLGSTAYKLLHRSTIPVLVVPSRPG